MNQDDRAASHILGVLQRNEESNRNTQTELRATRSELGQAIQLLRSMSERLTTLEGNQALINQKVTHLEGDTANKLGEILESNNKMGDKLRNDLSQTSMLLNGVQYLETNQKNLMDSVEVEYKSAASNFEVERDKLTATTRGLEDLDRKLNKWAGGFQERQFKESLLLSLGSALGGALVVLLVIFAMGHRPFVVEVSQETLKEADYGRRLNELLLSIPESERSLILDRIYDPENTPPLQKTPTETKNTSDKKKPKGKGKSSKPKK